MDKCDLQGTHAVAYRRLQLPPSRCFSAMLLCLLQALPDRRLLPRLVACSMTDRRCDLRRHGARPVAAPPLALEPHPPHALHGTFCCAMGSLPAAPARPQCCCLLSNCPSLAWPPRFVEVVWRTVCANSRVWCWQKFGRVPLSSKTGCADPLFFVFTHAGLPGVRRRELGRDFHVHLQAGAPPFLNAAVVFAVYTFVLIRSYRSQSLGLPLLARLP